ncbi:solute:Na+ symporter, SSS family [Anaerosphaera aminiphila DSM 21120]|uniref:Solute:Na+ symporter, SSS family n=1 Tax=Anaerosphaera aminiphila DSM 21120 TaxID=1120995 RepID=A0A1M5QST7_9FIRM|nr:sodium:solute symporter family protein [Anaerosphaera aminiphila]SHH17028.1 solute:Na+ symporter, SSS family [Anaerosphaera aminiphila DSM 21120]
MNSTQKTALIIIVLYMAATVAIGLVASYLKKKKSESKGSNNEDFLMAGKSLGPIMLAATLFAANTGGASTTGIATNVYSFGLSASWYVIASGIGFILVSFVAPFFRRSASNTVPEIIGKRYGKPSHIFTAITSILALFMATGAQIIATASIINSVTSLDFRVAAIVTTIVVILYTMIGGFASVTAANMMHVAFITIGMTIALFIMVSNTAIGGFAGLFEKANAVSASSGGELDLVSMTKVGLPTILGYIAMYCMTFPTGQEIVQTYSSAKDGKSAKTGSILAGIISAAYAIVPATIGLIAYACIDGYAQNGISSSALADATLTFAPPIISGLVLSSIVAATISSASGNMIGTATMFSNDIYVPYINKGERNDKKEVVISQIVMLVAGLFGLGVALSNSNIISVMMSAFALRSAGPFAAFVCGLFWDKVTAKAGFVAIVAGTIVSATWIFILDSPFGLSAIVPGAAVAFVVIYVVTKFDLSHGGKPAPMLEFDDE